LETKALENFQQELGEGIQVIALQQEHIKVVDYSWAPVAEYNKNSLENDIDDDKHLFRVERNAGHAAQKMK